jgi:hypothetical protein
MINGPGKHGVKSDNRKVTIAPQPHGSVMKGPVMMDRS